MTRIVFPKINRIKIIYEIALLNLIRQNKRIVPHTNTGSKIGVAISARYSGINKLR